MKQKLNRTYLRECFDYNSDNGTFKWRVRPLSHFTSEKNMNIFNSKYAGKLAGTSKPGEYSVIRISGIKYYAHRLAFVWMTGEEPQVVDHYDRNPSNNKWSNLRSTNQSVNNLNRTRSKRLNGIYKNTKSWQVSVRLNGTLHYGGSFSNFCDAVKARHTLDKELELETLR